MDMTFNVLPAYAELFAFSNFTFLHGASHGEELSERASQLGYSGLAITDECSLAGVVRAHVQRRKRSCRLSSGRTSGSCHADRSPAFGLILLAQNREGYGNLSELITLGRMRAPKGQYLLTPQDISRPEKEYHICAACRIAWPSSFRIFPRKKKRSAAQLEWMNDSFPVAHGSDCASPARDGRHPSRHRSSIVARNQDPCRSWRQGTSSCTSARESRCRTR